MNRGSYLEEHAEYLARLSGELKRQGKLLHSLLTSAVHSLTQLVLEQRETKQLIKEQNELLKQVLERPAAPAPIVSAVSAEIAESPPDGLPSVKTSVQAAIDFYLDNQDLLNEKPYKLAKREDVPHAKTNLYDARNYIYQNGLLN